MGSPFQFSDQIINYDSGVATSAIQPLTDALEVAAFDEMDVLMALVAVKTSGGSPSFVVSIITGMSTQTEDGWVTAATFANHTTAASEKL